MNTDIQFSSLLAPQDTFSKEIKKKNHKPTRTQKAKEENDRTVRGWTAHDRVVIDFIYLRELDSNLAMKRARTLHSRILKKAQSSASRSEGQIGISRTN